MFNIFRKKVEASKKKPKVSQDLGIFSDKLNSLQSVPIEFNIRDIGAIPVEDVVPIEPMLTCDDANIPINNKIPESVYNLEIKQQGISANQIDFFIKNGYLNPYICAIIGEHWLVEKACRMSGQDAIRNGYDVTTSDGDNILTPDVKKLIKKFDRDFKLSEHLLNFIHFSRVFGIRIALFEVESSDADYYLKPFNIDGVTPHSYKGIVQIDPMRIYGQLDTKSATNPASRHYMEPTWWRVNGMLVHRSHLVICIPSPVAKERKPTYQYGGVSVPQKIYERAYGAERTANEGPLLALSKRSLIYKTDVEKMLLNPGLVETKLNFWAKLLNNFGIRVLSRTDEFDIKDTSLADVDTVTMTQYQLVAAAANVPVTKLMGTSPKGFNATGEFEEKSYHEELKSIQTHHLTPLLERHHEILIRSEICPIKNLPPFEIDIVWKSLNSMTAQELAATNETKARTAAIEINAGVITQNEERQRLAADCDSGYDSLDLSRPIEELIPPENESDFETPIDDEPKI